MRTPATIACLILAAVAPLGAVQGQSSNPVYVDDSPGAWEHLRQARDQAAENAGEAVRLYQELLDEHGDRLVPRHEAATDEFVGVRGRVLADLRSDEALLGRYRIVQAAEAQRMLARGELERLAITRPLTEPGLAAILRMAQRDLEAARFHGALAWLEEAELHPDLTPERGAHGWFMAGLAAHYLGRPDRYEAAIIALEGFGRVGADSLASLRGLATNGDGPEIPHGLTPLDRTTTSELTDLVGQTIWSVPLPEALLQRRYGAGPADESGPSPGFERRRRQGDLTTAAATVAGTTIYVNEGHTVHALDRFTGRPVWPRAHRDEPHPALTDRDSSPAGDLGVIAVEGDALVTLTGHAYATSRSSDGRVICLDANTGRQRWETRLERIGGDRDLEGLFPHGAPVIAEQRVYVLARKISAQMLTGCYVVALDLATGDPEWVRLVASSGSKTKSARPFSTLSFVEGDLYVASAVGAIASIDAARGHIRWLRRSSVPVNARGRTRQPWELGAPVVVADRVIAITPDQARVIVLDRETGAVLQGFDAQTSDGWAAPAYLLANERMVYAIGNEIRAFMLDALEHPLWRLPAPAQSILDDAAPFSTSGGAVLESMSLVGRVQLVSDALVVPTLGGLLLVDSETGAVLHHLRIDASGNPLAIGAQLIIAGADSLSAYMSLQRAEEMLRERIVSHPDDPDPALSLVQLGMRVDDLALSLEGAELARRAIGRLAEPADPRAELFEMLLEIHRRDLARTADEREALFGMAGAVAATSDQRIEHLLAYGDALARETPDRAVETYQSILSNRQLAATVRDEDNLLRPAGRWVSARLAELIEREGPAIYAPQSDYARQSFEHLLASRATDDAAFAALAAEFPLAEASVDAALHAANVQLDRGDDLGALETLSNAHHAAPGTDRGRRLLGAFVEILERERPAQAREVLETLAAVYHDTPLVTTSGPRDVERWLAGLAPTREGAHRPRVVRPSALDAPLLAGRLVPFAPGAGPAPPDRALLLEIDDPEETPDAEAVEASHVLHLLEATDLERPLWSRPIGGDASVQILQHDARELLLWIPKPGDPRVVSRDPDTGRESWTTKRIEDLVDVPLGQGRRGGDSHMPNGMPFRARAAFPLLGHDRVFIVQRSGGVCAFDRKTGEDAWAVDHALQQVHLGIAHDFGVVLAGLAQEAGAASLVPTVVVLDPDRGTVVHQWAIDSRTGVIWMQGDPLGSVLCATPEGIESVDLLSGHRRWTNVAFDVRDTRHGWASGRHALVESRTNTLFTLRLDDGIASDTFSTNVRGPWGRDELEDVAIIDDRIFAHYKDRVIRYDLAGAVEGADVIADEREYRWLLPAEDRLVVVSRHVSRQVPVRNQARRQTEWIYRIYVLSDNCRLVDDPLEPVAFTTRIIGATLVDGHLLLGMDRTTTAIPLR